MEAKARTHNTMKLEVGDIVMTRGGRWMEVKRIHAGSGNMQCRIRRLTCGTWGDGPLVKISDKSVACVMNQDALFEQFVQEKLLDQHQE
jgi:hypothetical protein